MSEKLDFYKLVVLGDSIGAFALEDALAQGRSFGNDPMVIEPRRGQIKVDEQSCILDIRHLAGQEECTALRDQWISDGDCFILVYSTTSRWAFSRMSKFHTHIRIIKEASSSRSLNYQGPLLSPISNSLGSLALPPVNLVAYMHGEPSERQVSSREGLDLAKALGCSFVEACSKSPVNLEVFYDVVRQLRRQRHGIEQAAKAKQSHGPQYPTPSYYQPDDYVHSVINGPTEEKIDSGYGSAPDVLSKNNNQNDDSKSIRSILTNASQVFFPPEEKENLVSAFAGDLWQDISFRGDLDDEARHRIQNRLPELLKIYTLKLGTGINSKTQLDAKEFIRQQRNLITYQFRAIKMPAQIFEDENLPTLPEDSMSVAEKMQIAGWNTAEPYDCLPEPEPIDKQLEDVQVPPRYQQVRPFLLDGPAYQWLLKNAQSSAILTERNGTILEAVTREIDSALSSIKFTKPKQSHIFQIDFDIDWDLPGFLEGQDYGSTWELALERAITITGSSSNAQALGCMDYMCQTWPSSGQELILVLQKALRSPNLSCSSCLVDGTRLDINLGSSKTLIMARGGQASLIELGEQLVWLAAALRPSPLSSGICFATPSFTTSRDINSNSSMEFATVQIEIKVSTLLGHISSADADGTCWHAMFRNPVVVKGFPILARPGNERGLELPLSMMSTLGEAHFATRYNAAIVLKGLCTMLVPTRKTNCSITWHFLFNRDGKRVPYYCVWDRCPGWIGTDKVSLDLLEMGNLRNFVGWASNITRHIGTEEAKYDKIDWAGAKNCSPGLAVEQKLTISVSKIVGVGGSVVRGDRDKPEFVKQSSYSTQIENARNINVLLYDVAARRGWLVDGASALLHLVRTQVVQEPYGGAGSLFNNLSFNLSEFNHPKIDGGPNSAAETLRNDSNMKHAILREFDSYADETIAAPRVIAPPIRGAPCNHANRLSDSETSPTIEGRKEIYKTTCLRELVSQAWSTLEQIYDRQIEIATTHTTKQLRPQWGKRLEGYEFMGVVSGKHILTRRNVNLTSNGAAWIDLIHRTNGITLFGQNFGDIYKPSGDTEGGICISWRTVPQGQDYLVAPVSLLKDIKQRSWEEGDVDSRSPEVAKGLFYIPSKDAFNTCGPSCKHNFERVQQLHSSSSTRKLSKLDLFEETNGAILFGESSALDTQLSRLSAPPVVHMEGSSNENETASNLQSFYQSVSTSTSSGGVNSDSRSAQSSVRSTGTSFSPFNRSIVRYTGEVDLAEDADGTSGTKTPSKTIDARERRTRVWPANDNTVASSNSLSKPAISPGLAVTSVFTNDAPAFYRQRGKGGNIIAGLQERFEKMKSLRWKRNPRATSP